ncbi:MAG: AAA family ATPase, partial [Fusobacteriaceae bacterium]|nr:AAA family ATPase [Fusobacteriaceae bacterium]
MKKIPYGIANFEALKEESSYYYVDKTRYIEELENLGTKYHFFLRPRRFGKSLFISMLEHYYDINRKDQFDDLFGDTYIGKNPTKLRNSFPILKLNFSGIPTDKSIEDIEHSFDIVILGNLELFFSRYEDFFKITKSIKEEILSEKFAGNMLNRFISKMNELNIKYYLLIDEYDNFANNILIHHGKEKYTRVTHQAGFLRSFFAAIKVATESRTVER